MALHLDIGPSSVGIESAGREKEGMEEEQEVLTTHDGNRIPIRLLPWMPRKSLGEKNLGTVPRKSPENYISGASSLPLFLSLSLSLALALSLSLSLVFALSL